MNNEIHPPVCDYEGSDYQSRFWDKGGREYEDGCEVIALKKLLPPKGNCLLEVGAGAGRNTSRYTGYDHIVLLDYSRTQLQLARERLGDSHRYTFVVADIYRLPFTSGIFDAATMIRVLHHMADAPEALLQIRNALQPGGLFILEYANKLNFKAILRYILHKQEWNPFSSDPVEFMPLNFDFHPKYIKKWMTKLGFNVDRVIPVSYFRINFIKKYVPIGLLLGLETFMQKAGKIILGSPSVFLRAYLEGEKSPTLKIDPSYIFKCPNCEHNPLERHQAHMFCKACGTLWPVENGMYIFKS